MWIRYESTQCLLVTILYPWHVDRVDLPLQMLRETCISGEALMQLILVIPLCSTLLEGEVKWSSKLPWEAITCWLSRPAETSSAWVETHKNSWELEEVPPRFLQRSPFLVINLLKKFLRGSTIPQSSQTVIRSTDLVPMRTVYLEYPGQKLTPHSSIWYHRIFLIYLDFPIATGIWFLKIDICMV